MLSAFTTLIGQAKQCGSLLKAFDVFTLALKLLCLFSCAWMSKVGPSVALVYQCLLANQDNDPQSLQLFMVVSFFKACVCVRARVRVCQSPGPACKHLMWWRTLKDSLFGNMKLISWVHFKSKGLSDYPHHMANDAKCMYIGISYPLRFLVASFSRPRPSVGWSMQICPA